MGPHRKGNGMLGERVVVRAAVRLSMEETLALLWTLLVSGPLGLPLHPCETIAAVRMHTTAAHNSNF